jgi:hypothetical protein
MKRILREWEKLKNYLEKSQDCGKIKINENERKSIEIGYKELTILIEMVNDYYWVWTIQVSQVLQVSISPYIQSIFYEKAERDYEIEAEFRYPLFYEKSSIPPPLVCSNAKWTMWHIKDFIKSFSERGIRGIIEKFFDDYLILFNL